MHARGVYLLELLARGYTVLGSSVAACVGFMERQGIRWRSHRVRISSTRPLLPSTGGVTAISGRAY